VKINPVFINITLLHYCFQILKQSLIHLLCRFCAELNDNWAYSFFFLMRTSTTSVHKEIINKDRDAIIYYIRRSLLMLGREKIFSLIEFGWVLLIWSYLSLDSRWKHNTMYRTFVTVELRMYCTKRELASFVWQSNVEQFSFKLRFYNYL